MRPADPPELSKDRETIMTDLTRRKMLTVAAASAATAVGSVEFIEPAAADDEADIGLFVKLSAALTGIDENKLAPSVDPIQIKRDYFSKAQKHKPAFEGLMQIIRDDPTHAADAANKVMNNSDKDIQFLGRSIILAWYLGAWYERKNLEAPPPTPPVPAAEVISQAAYTQAWTWRVAQAHPMGYSELRFGYWSNEPLPLDTFIKP